MSQNENNMKFRQISDIPFCDEPMDLFEQRIAKGISVKDLWNFLSEKYGGCVSYKNQEDGIRLLIKAEKEMLSIEASK